MNESDEWDDIDKAIAEHEEHMKTWRYRIGYYISQIAFRLHDKWISFLMRKRRNNSDKLVMISKENYDNLFYPASSKVMSKELNEFWFPMVHAHFKKAVIEGSKSVTFKVA